MTLLVQRHTGGLARVTVSYAEVTQDDESWYDDINPILRAGESIGYDIMVVTDGFQFSELVSQGELTPLDQRLMQNFYRYARPRFKNRSFDPGNTYSKATGSQKALLAKVATSDLVFLRAAEYARLRNYADVSGKKQEQYLSIFQPIIGK
jgi:hypothetical protein